MLSRVAEHLYWLGRYIERAEDTARLFDATANLILDLPTNSPLNWSGLIEAVTAEAQEGEHSEAKASRWLLLDARNPSSVLSCITAARENGRVARDQIPRDAWEGLNRIEISLRERSATSLSRSRRSELLREVIWSCRHVAGVTHGSMSRDEAWQFLRLGLQLERADMSSRLIDFRRTSILPDSEWTRESDTQLGWMAVLQAQDGYEMYRHSVNNRVRGRDALNFLVSNPSFPRSLTHTLGEIESGLLGLPVPAKLPKDVRQIRQWVQKTPVDRMDSDSLSEFVDEFQSRLAWIHQAIQETFFDRNPKK